MEFFCENPAAGHADDRIWKGYVKQLRRHGDTVEADISGKGSAMHVIIGRYEYGRYLCIPDCGVGSTLAALDDCFWNREQLQNQLVNILYRLHARLCELCNFGRDHCKAPSGFPGARRLN